MMRHAPFAHLAPNDCAKQRVLRALLGGSNWKALPVNGESMLDVIGAEGINVQGCPTQVEAMVHARTKFAPVQTVLAPFKQRGWHGCFLAHPTNKLLAALPEEHREQLFARLRAAFAEKGITDFLIMAYDERQGRKQYGFLIPSDQLHTCKLSDMNKRLAAKNRILERSPEAEQADAPPPEQLQALERLRLIQLLKDVAPAMGVEESKGR